MRSSDKCIRGGWMWVQVKPETRLALIEYGRVHSVSLHEILTQAIELWCDQSGFRKDRTTEPRGTDSQ